MTVNGSAGSAVTQTTLQLYDKDGNNTATVSEPDTSDNTYSAGDDSIITRSTYDDHGNLTGSVKTYNDESGMQSETTYTYDDVGNRLTMQVDDMLTEYSYNGLNQLVSMSSGDASTEYTYDDRGNQIKEETTVSVDTGQDESEVSTVTTEMEYAVTGEMISLTKSDGSTTTLAQENVYNHDGIRISRDENGVKREYYYDSGVVAYTIDGSDISSVNVLSPEGAAIGTYRGDDYYTYLNDIQGSTTNLVKSDGSLAAAYDYTDFGETTEITGNNFDNQVCYTGGIYDEETALYYLNARYYDPATGRFISQDTYRGELNDPGQWHLYAYCANNPINYVDPSGHKYNPTKAVTYALKWAEYRNSKYKSFNLSGGDCTNYVSQCLEAGGLSQKRPSNLDKKSLIYSTTKYWYSKRYKRTGSGKNRYYWRVSTSWMNVADFWSFWKSNKRSKTYTNKSLEFIQNNAQKGDVVQMKIEGVWSHSIIITGGKKGNRRFCAHSTDRPNEYLSRYKSKKYKYRIVRPY